MAQSRNDRDKLYLAQLTHCPTWSWTGQPHGFKCTHGVIARMEWLDGDEKAVLPNGHPPDEEHLAEYLRGAHMWAEAAGQEEKTE